MYPACRAPVANTLFVASDLTSVDATFVDIAVRAFGDGTLVGILYPSDHTRPSQLRFGKYTLTAYGEVSFVQDETVLQRYRIRQTLFGARKRVL